MTLQICENILELIGKTPLVKLHSLADKKTNMYVKLESFNPTYNTKVRAAYSMILDAEKKGKLKAGGTIVESSSGNLGVALSMIGAIRGYTVKIVVDPRTTQTHLRNMKAYGAEIIMVTEQIDGAYQKSRIKKVKELLEKIPNSFTTNQYENPANPKAHGDGTAHEIYEALDGKIDYFVSAVSTGGTISGVGKVLKKKNPNIKVVAVDSEGSTIFGGKPGPRFMTGMGANYKPKNVDLSVIDKVIKVNDFDSFEMCNFIARNEGMLLGASSGAALVAAKQLAEGEAKGKTIVIVSADTGKRYLETIYNEDWLTQRNFTDFRL